MMDPRAQHVPNNSERGFWLPPDPRMTESIESTSQDIPNPSSTIADRGHDAATIGSKSVA